MLEHLGDQHPDHRFVIDHRTRLTQRLRGGGLK